tara:strand:+ start:1034 stop:2404 length:1371 start_codon:yes stop_codon:yes gene_type:complete
MTGKINFESIAKNYKGAVASKYRPLKPEEINSLPQGNNLVSRKIDGELWLAHICKDEVILFAKGGRFIKEGKIIESLRNCLPKNIESLTLAGELYVKKENRERVGDVAKAISEKDFDILSFAIFDLVKIEGKTLPLNYEKKLEELQSIFNQPKNNIKVIETVELNDKKSIKEFYEKYVNQKNSEGIIVRTSTEITYKVKPSITIDALVIGFTNKVNEFEKVRSVLLGLKRNDDSIQLLGACGNFLGDLRDELYKKLVSIETESKFRHSSSDGNLYRFVKPELVLEIKCTEIQREDSSSNIIRRMVLDFKENIWQPLALTECVSLIHPVIIRERGDKLTDNIDVRISQLESFMDSSQMDEKVKPIKLPESKIVERKVWTKDGKNGISIRKIIILQTFKSKIWDGWAEWIVFYSDFSAGRKSPLDRKLKTARSKEEAMEISENLIEANIKKGWELQND